MSYKTLYKPSGIILLTGIFYRVFQWFYDRSVWHDEAALALNLIERDFWDLLSPLDHGQVAPGAYLLFHESWSWIFGTSGMALRFPSLLAGCLSVWLFYRCLSDLFEKYPALELNPKKKNYYHKFLRFLYAQEFLLSLGLAFFSFCQMHVWYSVEFKPYALDTLLCLLVFYWSMHWVWSRKYFWHLFMAGLSFTWFSLPVVFALAAFGIVAVLCAIQEKKWTELLWLGGAGLLWLLSFGIQYELLLSAKVNNDFLQWQHEGYYWPIEFWKKENLHFYFRTLTGLVRNPGGILFKYLGSLVIGIGMIFGFRGQRRIFLLLWLPVFLAIGASAVHKYSLIQRLMLFIVPALFITLTLGIRVLFFWLKNLKYLEITPALLGLLLVLQPTLNVIHKTADPIKIMEVRPLLEEIDKSLAEADWVYVDLSARFSWWYYLHHMDLQLPETVIIGEGLHTDWKKEISKLKGRGWIITVYFDTTNHLGDYNTYQKELPKDKLKSVVKKYGAVALAYEF